MRWEQAKSMETEIGRKRNRGRGKRREEGVKREREGKGTRRRGRGEGDENQRTNGPVNAHLISWPSIAQNIQNLEIIW